MQKRILIFLLLVVEFVSSDAQTNFIGVTNTVLTTESFSGGGAAWADYDGDGWLDLAQANYDGANLLFHNNGDGTFTKITSGGVSIAGPESYGVSWGDYDNDGHPDLFFSNGYDSGIPNFLFHNQTVTNANFLRVTTGPGAANLTGHSSGCAWADYDRDGFLDLFVANSDEPSYLWHNKGDGTFERVLTGAVVTKTGNSVGAAWADYDNDGWPDLLVANGFNEGGKNFLYHNNRDGTFTQVKTGSVANDVGNFTGIAWGDYDNDGFLDVFVTVSNGHNYLYHNNGDGTFTSVTEGDIVNDTGVFASAGWADYDNDGWLDLFVGNRADKGNNLLYHNNGDGTFTKVATGPIVEEVAPNGGCAWGDYDNDGFPDLFVSVFGGNSLLYHNEGTTNNWVKVNLISTKSNASAIGAKVRVTAIIQGKSVTQMREISAGDGLNGNSQVALFGLANAQAIEDITIEWPSGAVSTSPPNPLPLIHHPVPANGVGRFQLLNIFEPQPLALSAPVLSRDVNSKIVSVAITLIGYDQTQYYYSGALFDETWQRHGYAIEVSDDLAHWKQYDEPGVKFLGGTKDVYLSVIGGGMDTQGQVFFRGRDLGFVLTR